MSLELLKTKKYAQILLHRPGSNSLDDKIAHSLALAAVGRVFQAKLLLSICLENTTDPAHKAQVLGVLEEISPADEFGAELRCVVNCDLEGRDFVPFPWSLGSGYTLTSAWDCVKIYREQGILMHPQSYAAAAAYDKYSALEFEARPSGTILLEVVGGCGPHEELKRVLETKAGKAWLSRAASLPNEDSALAAAYYILGDFGPAVGYAEGAIQRLCAKEYTATSAYELALLATMLARASGLWPEKMSEKAAERLIIQMVTPADHLQGLEPHICATLILRRASIFCQCARMYTAIAVSRATQVFVNDQPCSILYRAACMEMAHEYLQAAAAMPPDYPQIGELYQNAIVGLLLCGGVLVFQICALILIMNHVGLENRSLILPKAKTNPMFKNQWQIFNAFFDWSLDVSKETTWLASQNCDEVLCPTCLVSGDVLLMSDRYNPAEVYYTADGEHTVRPSGRLHALGAAPPPQYNWAYEWALAYADCHGFVPEKIVALLEDMGMMSE